MKHLIKNNRIVRSGIPSQFTRENGESFWGGYENRTELHAEDGWVDEILPEMDPFTQYTDSPYYDLELGKVTYAVLDRQDLPTLDQAKSDKVIDIKQAANQRLSGTDWYVVRKIEKNKNLPAEVSHEREAIRAKSDAMEAKVMSFQSLKEVMMFEIIY